MAQTKTKKQASGKGASNPSAQRVEKSTTKSKTRSSIKTRQTQVQQAVSEQDNDLNLNTNGNGPSSSSNGNGPSSSSNGNGPNPSGNDLNSNGNDLLSNGNNNVQLDQADNLNTKASKASKAKPTSGKRATNPLAQRVEKPATKSKTRTSTKTRQTQVQQAVSEQDNGLKGDTIDDVQPDQAGNPKTNASQAKPTRSGASQPKPKTIHAQRYLCTIPKCGSGGYGFGDLRKHYSKAHKNLPQPEESEKATYPSASFTDWLNNRCPKHPPTAKALTDYEEYLDAPSTTQSIAAPPVESPATARAPTVPDSDGIFFDGRHLQAPPRTDEPPRIGDRRSGRKRNATDRVDDIIESEPPSKKPKTKPSAAKKSEIEADSSEIFETAPAPVPVAKKAPIPAPATKKAPTPAPAAKKAAPRVRQIPRNYTSVEVQTGSDDPIKLLLTAGEQAERVHDLEQQLQTSIENQRKIALQLEASRRSAEWHAWNNTLLLNENTAWEKLLEAHGHDTRAFQQHDVLLNAAWRNEPEQRVQIREEEAKQRRLLDVRAWHTVRRQHQSMEEFSAEQERVNSWVAAAAPAAAPAPGADVTGEEERSEVDPGDYADREASRYDYARRVEHREWHLVHHHVLGTPLAIGPQEGTMARVANMVRPASKREDGAWACVVM